MEEKEKNLPKEEQYPNHEDNMQSPPKLEDSPKGANKLSSNVKLSDEQKEEVKSLLKFELDTSVQNIKDEVKNEGQEIKKDFLVIFGLFASFVTFLSIEVQVFKNRDNIFELVGISSISLSFVIYFALVINDIAKEKNEWKDFAKPTYIINLFFAVLGIIFLYTGGTSSIHRIDIIEKQIKLDSAEIYLLKSDIQRLNNKIQNVNTQLRVTNDNPTPAQPKSKEKAVKH